MSYQITERRNSTVVSVPGIRNWLVSALLLKRWWAILLSAAIAIIALGALEPLTKLRAAVR